MPNANPNTKTAQHPPSALQLFDLRRHEYQEWQTLVRLLIELGVATTADAKSSQHERDTPGQRLYAQIREWGEALAQLRTAQPPAGPPL
jgi:hypothetical protein